METDSNIQIKGTRDGLMVRLVEDDWKQAYKSLLDHLDQQNDFLKGARLVIDVGDLDIRAADLSVLRKEISEREITLWAVLSESSNTKQIARDLGLETSIAKPDDPNESKVADTILTGSGNSLYLRKTLRSGFSMQHEGHVTVVGDVNPGAEIIASGDIVVWGRIRGMVHAGAEGDETAVICGLDISPTQLRIAGKVAVAPKRRGKPKPEIVFIEDNEVVADVWNPGR
jgi:septum site-determining protein MinC